MNDWYDLTTFVPCQSNQFAYDAILAAVRGQYRLLYLYGPTGSGKTHLLFGASRMTRGVYLDAQELKFSQLDDWSCLRQVKLLFIDGIDALWSDQEAQEWLRLTLDASMTPQVIVVAGLLPPAQLPVIPDLQQLLAGGLTADLKAPSPDICRQLLQRELDARGLDLPESTLNDFSDRMVCAHQPAAIATWLDFQRQVLQQPPDELPPLSQLRSWLPELEIQITPEEIISATAIAYGVFSKDIPAWSRRRQVVAARQISCYLLHELAGLSYPRIGRLVDRDHTTVMHSCRRVEQRMAASTVYGLKVAELKRQLLEQAMPRPATPGKAAKRRVKS